MTTSVTFELATILDAVTKAAIIAPAKAGNAFDKAAGIMLNIDPQNDPHCVVQSTNLDSFYIESVEVISASGAATRWRMPTQLIAEILKNITQAPGKTVIFERDPSQGRLAIRCGRMRATMGLIDPEFYPEFDLYDGDFSTTNGVGARIEQVAWACGKSGTEPLTGVHFTGEHIIATDRYRVARTPLKMPISSPITVPAGIIASVIKKTGDIEVGATDHQIVFRVDEYCQVYSAIYANPYPAIERRVTSIVYDGQFKIHKARLSSLINMATVAAIGDRSPIVRLILGKEEVAAFLNGQDAGIGDAEPIPGQLTHPRISVYLTPGYILDAINRAPGDLITFSYMNEDETKTPVKIEDGSGYEAWIAPRSNLSNDGAA